MNTAPARRAVCEGCSRQQDDTPGMLSVRQGGMATYLCFDCLDEMKSVADAARRDALPLAAD